MFKRAGIIFGVIGLFIGAAASTWLLSWLGQYIASITTKGGPAFNVATQADNRLALTTTVAAFIAAFIWLIIINVGGFWIFVVFLFAGGAIAAAFDWLADHGFRDTPVVTGGAKLLYVVVTVVAWGFALFFVFLADLIDDEI